MLAEFRCVDVCCSVYRILLVSEFNVKYGYYEQIINNFENYATQSYFATNVTNVYSACMHCIVGKVINQMGQGTNRH